MLVLNNSKPLNSTGTKKIIFLKKCPTKNKKIKISKKKSINNRDKGVIAKRFALFLWKTERKVQQCSTACTKGIK